MSSLTIEVTPSLMPPRSVQPRPEPLEELTLARLDLIRDIYVYENALENVELMIETAWCYYGGDPIRRPIEGTEVAQWCEGLFRFVIQNHPRKNGEEEFRITYGDASFRATRQNTVEGPLLNLRRLPKAVPELHELVMPPYWREFFAWQGFKKGGMLILAAVMGQGKSTTLAATAHSWQLSNAGFGVAIEDPPELPLHGPHGDGFIAQVNAGEAHGGYYKAIRRSLRQYPSVKDGGGLLLVGEVRDPEVAGELVRAAVNGTFVLTTIHASDPKTAIARLCALASQGMGEKAACDLVASAVRLVVHQKLTFDPTATGWRRGRISGDLLFNPHDSHAVANNIRNGEFAGLVHPLGAQRRAMERPRPVPFSDLVKELS